MLEQRAFDETDRAFENIRIENGVGDLFIPRLEQRVALLSRDDEAHTTFELCYVGIKDKTYLALCTLFEERLNKILIITTGEALELESALKKLIDDNSLTITAPITDE